MMNKHNCRVCGFYNKTLPWGEDEKSPTYEICPCCGVEFGNEDSEIESTKKYRQKWLEEGAIWFDKKERTEDWNLSLQLSKIPKIYL